MLMGARWRAGWLARRAQSTKKRCPAMLDRTGPIVRVQGLTKRFEASRPWLVRTLARKPRRIVHAVADVTFAIQRRPTFALVGESGCGESTIPRRLARSLKTPPRPITLPT